MSFDVYSPHACANYNSVQTHLDTSKAAESSATEAHSNVETRVVALLEDMKSEIASREGHAEENASLREKISQQTQLLDTNTEQIKDLEAKIAQHVAERATLNKLINDLQDSVATLQHAKVTAETETSRIKEAEGSLRRELDKMKNERVEAMATVTSLNGEKNNLLHEKGELQVSRSSSSDNLFMLTCFQRRLEEASRLAQAQKVVPNSCSERAMIEAKARYSSFLL